MVLADDQPPRPHHAVQVPVLDLEQPEVVETHGTAGPPCTKPVIAARTSAGKGTAAPWNDGSDVGGVAVAGVEAVVGDELAAAERWWAAS